MNLYDFKAQMQDIFGDLLEQFAENDEYGFNNPLDRNFSRLGYSTNLTPEIINQAREKNIQLIFTHHDAWNFMDEMRSECLRLLEQYGITHYYVHLPLDFAEFGTCNSLLRAIGITSITQQTHFREREIIGIGEYNHPITFEELVDRVSRQLNETVHSWKNSNQVIQRVGVITGAGNSTVLIKEAKEANCDVYITGEKSLYSVQYARFMKMNLIVGSHTFTEILGVRSLAQKIHEKFKEVDIIELIEEHIEL